MSMPALTFYFAPGSSSMAPHIALHEIGVAFEPRPMSFHADDMKKPDFLRINPKGKVPALVIEGRPLTEVAAILFYLARRFPEAGLLPPGIIEGGDAESEAQAISWMSFIASGLHPANWPLGQEPAPESPALKAANHLYTVADGMIADREWALGAYSIVDIHLFRLYWRFAGKTNPPPGRFPHLAAHHDRMMARPAVQKTIAIESAIGYELPA